MVNFFRRTRSGIFETPVEIVIGNTRLHGDLTLSLNPSGIVLFSHGSGSGRHSPRNKYVAWVLQQAGIGTLLFDLLTEQEEVEEFEDAHLRFDIALLTRRLVSATDWVARQPDIKELAIGYFGASTGAAAALSAAVERPDLIKAVVSRGGRPDLAINPLEYVKAPTLLIVGGRDLVVHDLNRMAYDRLKSRKMLTVVPGATHLFEEKGTLEEVGRLAADWFKLYLK